MQKICMTAAKYILLILFLLTVLVNIFLYFCITSEIPVMVTFDEFCIATAGGIFQALLLSLLIFVTGSFGTAVLSEVIHAFVLWFWIWKMNGSISGSFYLALVNAGFCALCLIISAFKIVQCIYKPIKSGRMERGEV